MSASIYYKEFLKDRRRDPPDIVFRNIHSLKERYNINYLDYVLFRFNIIVQTDFSNHEHEAIPGFSTSISGNMQIYPTTFTEHKQTMTLNNRINDNDTFTITPPPPGFPYGRMIYCTDTILDNVVANIEEKLTVDCVKHCGNSVLTFNFQPFDTTTNYECQDLKLIYSINVELLNTGKIPLESISTRNFDFNING